MKKVASSPRQTRRSSESAQEGLASQNPLWWRVSLSLSRRRHDVIWRKQQDREIESRHRFHEPFYERLTECEDALIPGRDLGIGL